METEKQVFKNLNCNLFQSSSSLSARANFRILCYLYMNVLSGYFCVSLNFEAVLSSRDTAPLSVCIKSSYRIPNTNEMYSTVSVI